MQLLNVIGMQAVQMFVTDAMYCAEPLLTLYMHALCKNG